MPAVEHEPVVGKPELAGGSPTRLGIPVQVPLAQVGGRVSALAQDLGKGDDGVLEGHVVAGRSGGLRIKTRDPRSPGRRAYRGRGKVIGANHPVLGQGIDVRSVHFVALAPDESLLRAHLVAVATEGAQVMLVGLNDDDVRSVGPERKERETENRKERLAWIESFTGKLTR